MALASALFNELTGNYMRLRQRVRERERGGGKEEE